MERREGSILVKRLGESERTWFVPTDAPRRSSPRTDGISLGIPAVREAMNPGRRQKIGVTLRWFDGRRQRQRDALLVRRSRTWVIESTPIRSALFDDLASDALVFALLEPWSSGIKSDWTISLALVEPRLREHRPLATELLEYLDGKATRRVPDARYADALAAASACLPVLGGARVVTGDMTSIERDDLVDWLTDTLEPEELAMLARGGGDEVVTRVLEMMGHDQGEPGARELAERVASHPGVELLADAQARDLLARRRFPRHTRNYPRVGRWFRGKDSARRFVKELGLPAPLAGTPSTRAPDREDIEAYAQPGVLHAYQEDLANGIVEVLGGKTAPKRRAILWLPTGTGKTRVTVETLLMNCRLEPPRNVILWVANREELCEQAIEAFRQIWMARGYDTPSAGHAGVPTLRFHRMFGGRDWQDPTALPTIAVAGIQTLVARLDSDEENEEFLAMLGRRCAAIVFDEAHHVVASGHSRVMRALGLERHKNYLGDSRATAPPLLGLTATPSRSREDETRRLSRRFGGQLIEPREPYRRIEEFARRGYLSHPVHEVVKTGARIRLHGRGEREHVERFGSLPQGALARLGEEEARTAAILADLEPRLDHLRSVLVFACSVEHARVMAEALVRRGHPAAALHGATPRAVRWQTIRQFRLGRIQVLVNCNLLTTGFDAPNVDAIVLARPVESRVLYAQMVGRGLRGPLNGGTESCLILDYEDAAGEFPDLDVLRAAFRSDFLMLEEGEER